ncbi:helix-turn-helix transcriptional regulator [Ectothiorhodospira lacustris]|uniref:helix-turn-helix transcriptional regulator n=1 Tax=Ectothiorhodospira lacustris TaxID=2899127 RepID=UPI001EE98FCD|nr:helix-turn-helix transcriptional regulator [Ectothiorhodospira lacustris]MCG5502194.1 helix-turn-helix transcriptional regulator [Ectothiorhodospira lacustris]MCG5510269.1 helix-turn-helix transcriptional regulator [Ectothiorhodospira lacustris]MCG5521864.1 helix-turn-helix transcriptional regulator [Ectothiorhodospira lacustris]
MTLAPRHLVRICIAALFIAWLTALPMSGMLLTHEQLMPWFLAPHVCVLFGLGRLAAGMPAQQLQQLIRIGLIGTVGLSLLALELKGGWSIPLMVLLGIVSAPVSLRMGQYLKASERPIVFAALALAAGNLLALALGLAPLSPQLKLTFVSVLLLFLLTPLGPGQPHRATTPTHLPQLLIYLPFIFVFQIVSGLMYGGLIPAYEAHAVVPGLEVIFYGVGAIGCLWLVKYTQPTAMLIGVVSALAAFALWSLLPSGVGIHGAMFFMMAAAGIIDLLLLFLVLKQTDLVRAYGYGVGVLCGGILVGHLLSMALGGAADTIAFVGLILLNMAVLSLYLPRKGAETTAADDAPSTQDSAVRLPDALTQILSDQEQQVLRQVLTEKTYREVADALSISESSVKTYMHRIFQKTGVYRRHQLLELIRDPGSTLHDVAQNPAGGERKIGVA